MKNTDFQQSVVQTVLDQVNAVIFSTDHLIGYNLAKTLAEHQLVVHLIHTQADEPFLASPSPQVMQFQYDDLDDQVNQSADYVFCVFPHRKENNEFLLPIVHSCKKQASKLLVVEEYGNPKVASLLEFLKKEAADVDTRIVLVSTPYGPNFGNQPTGVVSQWLLAAYNNEALILPSRGQEVAAPLYIDDLCQGLIQAMFKTQTNHQVFVLASLENRPLLDMAHVIRDLVEETLGYSPTVDFSNSVEPLRNPPESAVAATQASISWEPQTDFEQGLRSTMEYLRDQSLPKHPKMAQKVKIEFNPTTIETPKIDPTPQVKPHLLPINSSLEKHFNHFKKRKHLRRVSIFLTILALIGIFLLPGGIFWYDSNLAITNLTQSASQLEASKPKEAKELANRAKRQFTDARNALSVYGPLSYVIGDKLGKYDRLMDAAIRISDVMVNSADVVQIGQDLYQYILGNSQSDFETLATSLKGELDLTYNQVSLIQIALNNLSFDSSFDSFTSLNQIKEKLPQLKGHLESALSLVEILPKVIGSSQANSILILVEDSNELRPTGGFNNSYVLLTFKSGRLVDQQVDTTISLDSKLDGHVEPPQALKKHMGEMNWYIRDANWNPDFPTSAKQIQWFFEKEAGKPIGGVIAVDTNVLKSITKTLGTVSLPVSSQTVNEKNFVDFITQKASGGDDNLTAVTKGLVQTSLQGNVSLSSLAAALVDGLNRKGILVYLNDQSLQTIFDKNNWSGAIKNAVCPAEFVGASCTVETLGLVEANVGVNKNNYFLNRSISHQVKVGDDGKIQHQIDITYTNQSPQPGVAGSYKTYTQFVAPVGSQLQVSLDQVPLVIEENSLIGKTGLMTFGFYYEIPASTQKHLVLTINSPQIINTYDPLSALSINWQKQPGTGDDPIYVSLIYPAKLKPTQISMPASNQPQRLQFNSQLSRNMVFATEFKQK